VTYLLTAAAKSLSADSLSNSRQLAAYKRARTPQVMALGESDSSAIFRADISPVLRTPEGPPPERRGMGRESESCVARVLLKLVKASIERSMHVASTIEALSVVSQVYRLLPNASVDIDALNRP